MTLSTRAHWSHHCLLDAIESAALTRTHTRSDGDNSFETCIKNSLDYFVLLPKLDWDSNFEWVFVQIAIASINKLKIFSPWEKEFNPILHYVRIESNEFSMVAELMFVCFVRVCELVRPSHRLFEGLARQWWEPFYNINHKVDDFTSCSIEMNVYFNRNSK